MGPPRGPSKYGNSKSLHRLAKTSYFRQNSCDPKCNRRISFLDLGTRKTNVPDHSCTTGRRPCDLSSSTPCLAVALLVVSGEVEKEKVSIQHRLWFVSLFALESLSFFFLWWNRCLCCIKLRSLLELGGAFWWALWTGGWLVCDGWSVPGEVCALLMRQCCCCSSCCWFGGFFGGFGMVCGLFEVVVVF